MKKTDTPRCTFCNLQLEKIEHIFFECACVKQIWLEVERVGSILFNHNVNLMINDIILGFNLYEKSETNIVFNKVILYSKYYIWMSKMNNSTLSITSLARNLVNHVTFDESIKPLMDIFN